MRTMRSSSRATKSSGRPATCAARATTIDENPSGAPPTRLRRALDKSRSINVFCRHVELHQNACHRALEFDRQRHAAADPVDYLGIGGIQQALVGAEFRRADCFEIPSGENSKDPARLPRPPTPPP